MSTLFPVLQQQPVKVTTAADGKKQYTYDKNIINKALQNENNSIHASENENGHFVSIGEKGENEERFVHKLRDQNFDGIFDSYQLSEYDDKNNRTYYNDKDFDGIFDSVGYEYPDMNALDSNADGEIDFYEYPQN